MPEPKLTRRTFLQTTTAAAALSTVPALAAAPAVPKLPTWPENGNLIPDEGWTLWVDREAQWKDDTLYLPEQLTRAPDGTLLSTAFEANKDQAHPLPVNPPTGGWQALTQAPGQIPVTLPATVEQHCWSQFGQRPYTPEEYRYASDDPIPQNGAYFGVSWWHRSIDIPAAMRGKRIFLHIRGAHLRAEVYLNQKLVGYSIMEELPFECDLTNAANPGGESHLAIRITNPFGRFDWVDGLNAQWGAVKLYRSHGFGGLDRGMSISAHSGPRISDLYVLNTPNAHTISIRATLESVRPDRHPGVRGSWKVEVVDPATSKTLKGSGIGPGGSYDEDGIGGVDRPLPPEKLISVSKLVMFEMTYKEALLWELDAPKLYHLRLSWSSEDGHTDTRTIPFGFRWFAPAAVGTNGIFRLNGRRIKLYSSISWGFWGLNGMWPTPELAEKEVTQAKKLNLNCLNFHRNLAKEDVLRAHDRLGLLRYMEPGAGKLAIGSLPAGVQPNTAGIIMQKPVTEADKFAQRYMFVKCVEMVKAFRGHTSVIQYTLQNEIGADLKNPATIAVLEAMRAEDPSRCIVLNDGFVAPPRRAAQAWYEPYNPKLHRSDEEEWGGWWNQHQGAGDQWYDDFYKSPTDFTYQSLEHKALSEFGEMEGCATPDNHSLMLHQHADPLRTGIGNQSANKSYDHTDHQEILAATDAFLDQWNFRKAFPATESLWLSIGKKCYDTWQNYLENARISDNLDFAVISGWESTAIENHSGIVDNLRNFKSDPTPIAATLQPIRPVAKQRSMCTAAGQPATFDLFLLNDTAKPATGTLTFTVVTPSGKLLKLATLPIPTQIPDSFSYLIKESFTTPALNEEGMYRFKFALSSAPQSTQTKEIWVTSLPHYKRTRAVEIAVSGISPALRQQLTDLAPKLGLKLFGFIPGQRYDLILTAGLTATTSDKQESGDTTGLEAQPTPPSKPGSPSSMMPPVPGRKLEPGEAVTITQLGHIDPAILEAVRGGTPLLAMPQADTLSEGVARQLAAVGAFTYKGTVGDFRAPWMGNWYFVREHPLFAGMPVNQCMGIHYQAKGRQSNGLLVEGPNVEILVAYSRDHDRNIGAGTFTTRLGSTKVLYHRVPEIHPVLQQRFLANAIAWLTTK